MARHPDDGPDFDAVVRDEHAAIHARRAAVGAAAAGDAGGAPADLVGLALSGGGICSATFSLGVVQALAEAGLLPLVDYLSTVSGGGFLGGALSALLSTPDAGPQPDRFPLIGPPGRPEPPAARHLRHSSHYLAPGGLLDRGEVSTAFEAAMAQKALDLDGPRTAVTVVAPGAAWIVDDAGYRYDIRRRGEVLQIDWRDT